ncbi:hypothetical protein CMV_027401 [Castanea mollissima]|uniref:Uncharacterized protein n=1 Tax=Castanea mollissima TaxID=60419 RepID=A0A8J4Q6K8_9ROSI|nr:hypothetical protein CMV_027401 [Castanea mollissima]
MVEASLRVDAVASAGFKISRSKLVDSVRYRIGGKKTVFVALLELKSFFVLYWSYHLNIALAAAVGNAIDDSKVSARKDLGSSSSSSSRVVSLNSAKCENECDDENDQAKYLSNKFNV